MKAKKRQEGRVIDLMALLRKVLSGEGTGIPVTKRSARLIMGNERLPDQDIIAP
jgi:hypothetical protein